MKKITTDFLTPLIKQYQIGGKIKKYNGECVVADNKLGELILKLLWVRDQAHIFHWQTKANAQHIILGEFYTEFLDEVDELVEGIFGVTGELFTIGAGSMNFVDFSEENLKEFLMKTTNIFNKDFSNNFEKNKENDGLYHTVGDILQIIAKLKYLLSQK